MSVGASAEAAAEPLISGRTQDQHPELRESVSRFTTGILGKSPRPEGVDGQLFQKPQRIHMTLGVMALVSDEEATAQNDAQSGEELAAAKPNTISDALQFLESLRPELIEAMKGEKELSVPLKGLFVMNDDPERANVLWTGPGTSRDESALWRVSCESCLYVCYLATRR